MSATSGWRVALPFAALLALAAPVQPAGADTLTVQASAPSGPGAVPSDVDLTGDFNLKEPAFLGIVLTRGPLAACPADYAQAMAEPDAYPVYAQTSGPTEPPAAGDGVGDTVVLPGGSWSLCGWAQPEGNTSTARASAVSGPASFTVAGTGGSTALSGPSQVGQEQPARVVVAYALAQTPGEFEGSTDAELFVQAARGAGACPGSVAGEPVQLRSSPGGARSALLNGPLSGSASFTGILTPGTYSLCAYMVQAFPDRVYATLPGLLPPPLFATSTGTISVLARPLITDFRAAPRTLRARAGSAHGGSSRTVLRYSLNERSAVTITVARLVEGRRARGARECVRSPVGRGSVCGVPEPVGSVLTSAGEGSASTALSLRIGRRTLEPGVYLATASAESAAHETSAAVSTGFAVLR